MFSGLVKTSFPGPGLESSEISMISWGLGVCREWTPFFSTPRNGPSTAPSPPCEASRPAEAAGIVADPSPSIREERGGKSSRLSSSKSVETDFGCPFDFLPSFLEPDCLDVPLAPFCPLLEAGLSRGNVGNFDCEEPFSFLVTVNLGGFLAGCFPFPVSFWLPRFLIEAGSFS